MSYDPKSYKPDLDLYAKNGGEGGSVDIEKIQGAAVNPVAGILNTSSGGAGNVIDTSGGRGGDDNAQTAVNFD